MTHASSSWWRDAVIYQIYPRSFADANGDGIGDLAGIRSRLGYLAELGVDAIWLSPFYASPQADGGYDVADYRAVDPAFGDLAEAEALLDDAHAHGLRVIVDLVPNHSSDQHEWFRQAVADGPGSAARGRYHFRTGRGADGELPPNDWESVFGGPAWTRLPDGEWYLHLFAPEQPDFNWEHPAVADEFRTILRFWLDRGVDGVRVDVAHGLVKAAGLPDLGGDGDQVALLGHETTPYFDQDGVHEIYRDWRRLLDEYDGDRVAVAEAWAPSLERLALYVRADELQQAFNFHYLGTHWESAAQRRVIVASLAAMEAVGAPATWALSNHDVARHSTRFAHDTFRGTQLREPGDRALGLRRARAASLLMLALPGSAYLYQGEELGLPEVTDLPDEVRADPSFARAEGQDGFRDGCRVPIPWTRTGASYGFGELGSWLPQPADWGEYSVEAETGDASSTLELYRTALRLRRTHPALGWSAGLTWLDLPDDVLGFRREADSGPAFVCLANAGGDSVRLPVTGELLHASGPVEISGDKLDLPADTATWWSV